MVPTRPERTVELPVRSLQILERDGRRVRALRVLCPRVRASIAPTACTTCPFVRGMSEIAVTCAPPGIPGGPESSSRTLLFVGPDALALHTPVGAVCAPCSVAVRVDVPIARARGLLDRHSFVVVLTSDDRVHGILSAVKPLEGLSTLAEMDDSTHALPESAPLTEAIELMVHGHVRFVFVTGDDRHFVGLVTDLDVLRWVAQRHTAMVPIDDERAVAEAVGKPTGRWAR